MKKIKYLAIILLLFMVNINKIEAVCNENIDELKEIAKKVEITYKLNEEYYVNGEKINGTFKIEIKNLPNTMYARILGTDICFIYEEDNSIVKEGIEDGTKKITIYNNCGIELRTVTLKIPKYNKYSDREECIGVNTKELEVCDRWYQYDLNESIFQYKLKEYDERQDKIENIEKETDKSLSSIIEFFNNYYLYIIVGTLFIILIIVIIIFRKKKNSLE